MSVGPAAPAAAPNLAELDFDYLEFYVGNAKQAAYYYCAAFGFEQVAYCGPETGVADRVSYLLRQNDLRFLLTSSLRGNDAIASHVARHGDGIKDVALRVRDARSVFAAAVRGGARVIHEPRAVEDELGRAVTAAIASYGDTVHTLVERDAYRGPFLPGFVAASSSVRVAHPVGLRRVDHAVGNVGWNEMDSWGEYYAKAFGFTQLVSFDDHDISTEYTALKSKVMSDARRVVKFPINEPAAGKRKSQIEEFLDFYGGPGVQHVAIATDDIIATVRALRANGVDLLEAPSSYYDDLAARVGGIDEAIAELRDLHILVDRDDLGYMLQIFTKPVGDRPTLFFELIQRKGSLSFGKGNFKALFVSIEKEQEKRGTL